MQESKIALTDRLRREGRWEQASMFKDDYVAKLRSEGKSRKEAQDAAWEAMEREFPKLVSEAEPDTETDYYPPELTTADLPASADFHADAIWVYQHISVANLKPEDAPSAGAWALLDWAKRNRNRFFEQVMPKATAAKKQSDLLFDDLQGPDPSLHEIHEQLDYFFSSWQDHAIENVARIVKDEMNQNVYGWHSRFRLNLSKEVLNDLVWHLIRITDDLIHAALNNPEAFRNRPSGQARR